MAHSPLQPERRLRLREETRPRGDECGGASSRQAEVWGVQVEGVLPAQATGTLSPAPWPARRSWRSA